MNTQDLIDAISASPAGQDLTKKQVEAVVLQSLEAISDALSANEEVSLRNFGRFFIHTRPARNGRNPRTGEALQIPERSVVKFKARGELKG